MVLWAPRTGWYAWRPAAGTELPGWLVELALTVECPPLGAGASWPQALLLGRARDSVLGTAAAVCRELEAVAGVRPAGGLELGPAPALAGLDPVPPLTVARHLGSACRRGLLAPRPWRSEDRWTAARWEAGPGAALTAWGPVGRSVQAVVLLGGRGDPGVLAPRPGGAVVLRAWRVGRVWGAVSALVLAAGHARGLGRDAARTAWQARAGGWQAMVAGGDEAVAVARAGDPRQPIPVGAARRMPEDELASLVAACTSIGLSATWIPPPGEPPQPPDALARRSRLAQLLTEPDEPSPPLPLPLPRR